MAYYKHSLFVCHFNCSSYSQFHLSVCGLLYYSNKAHRELEWQPDLMQDYPSAIKSSSHCVGATWSVDYFQRSLFEIPSNCHGFCLEDRALFFPHYSTLLFTPVYSSSDNQLWLTSIRDPRLDDTTSICISWITSQTFALFFPSFSPIYNLNHLLFHFSISRERSSICNIVSDSQCTYLLRIYSIFSFGCGVLGWFYLIPSSFSDITVDGCWFILYV